jgi:hypothetical protein
MVQEESYSSAGDTLFDVLFRGDILPGNTIDDVKARVAEGFKLDESAANQLFSGTVMSLKRNVDRVTAERICQRLSNVGAQANIVQSLPLQSDMKKQGAEKGFTLAPIGTDVLDRVDDAEEDHPVVSLDHIALQPIGSDIVDQSEREKIDPREVDTSHLSLE